jgi:hypothetical protein
VQVTAAHGRKALVTEANTIFETRDWTLRGRRDNMRDNTQVQQPLLNDAWKHLKVRGWLSQRLAAMYSRLNQWCNSQHKEYLAVCSACGMVAASGVLLLRIYCT